MVNDGRSLYLDYSERFKQPDDLEPAITSFFHEDATINIVHPFNRLKGSKAYIEDLDNERESSFELG